MLAKLAVPVGINLNENIDSLIIENDGRKFSENDELESIGKLQKISNPMEIVEKLPLPPDCCPKFIFKRFLCCKIFIPKKFRRVWTLVRSRALQLVEHQFFERLIIGSILASSTTLASSPRKRRFRFSMKILLFFRLSKI